LTAITLTPSSSATSAARQPRTSRKISTVRCLAGSCCMAAIRASRSPDRAAATAAGSADSGRSSASGNGSSHGTSDAGDAMGPAGSPLGAPSPEGSGRRCRFSIARRQALVAIRYSHVRSEDRPSKLP
jgi:hypothetical protein